MNNYREPSKKMMKEMTREEYLYHNTKPLLEYYRDIYWSINDIAELSKDSIGFDNIKEFLEMSYQIGIDMSGTKLEEQQRNMEMNKNILLAIDNALARLRTKPNKGEIYYNILYYTYIDGKYKRKEEEILDIIEKNCEYLSKKRYYKLRKEAITVLSYILWGFTSAKYMKGLKCLFAMEG